MSSFTNTPNFDNLVLQNLMGRLQINPPATTHNHHPLFSRSFEDLLLDAASNFPDESDEDNSTNRYKSHVAREESLLEREIIRIIHSGKTDSLKPNSGEAITIREHHICVGFHQDKGSDYRVWEWHGHIVIYDEVNGFGLEYIYGNYFERLWSMADDDGEVSQAEDKEETKKEEQKVVNMGLRDLIDEGSSKGSARILHRNINGSSPKA